MKNKGLKVKEGRIELIVEHKGKDLTFVYPPVGPSNYLGCLSQLRERNLRGPTLGETVSLLYAAFNSSDKYSEEIKRIMKNNRFFGFTGSLYLPRGEGDYSNGVIIQDNPEIINGRVSMDKKSLVEKLESRDSSVRFVPFGYKTEEQTSEELSKNSFIIGLVGQEGAEKLAVISDKHSRGPYVWSFRQVNDELPRVSTLGSDGELDDYGLVVDGGSWDDYDGGGYAFGVLDKSAESA